MSKLRRYFADLFEPHAGALPKPERKPAPEAVVYGVVVRVTVTQIIIIGV